MAAVLSCGDGALLSGRAAGHLLGIVKGLATGARGDGPHRAASRRGQGPARTRARRGSDDLARDPRHQCCPHARGPRSFTCRSMTLRVHVTKQASVTTPRRRWSRPCSRGARNSPGAAKLRKILRGEVRVTLSKLEARFLERLREAGLAAPADEPPGRGPARRLPLAEAAPDGRARQLPLSPVPPRVGAGPAPRARGPRPWRRVPPLHLRRRLRPPGDDALRAARAAPLRRETKRRNLTALSHLNRRGAGDSVAVAHPRRG